MMVQNSKANNAGITTTEWERGDGAASTLMLPTLSELLAITCESASNFDPPPIVL